MRSDTLGYGTRYAAICVFAIALQLGAPSVAAENNLERGSLDTRSFVVGEGDGEFSHRATHMDWHPTILRQDIPAFVAAAQIQIYVKEELMPSIAAGTVTYTHYDSDEPRLVKQFSDAKLDLSALTDASKISLRCAEFVESFTRIDSGFTISTPRPAQASYGMGDLRGKFERHRQWDVELRQPSAQSWGQGDFEIMFENVGFTVETANDSTSYRAANESVFSFGSYARVQKQTTYFAIIKGGSYSTGGLPGEAIIRSPMVRGNLAGSLTAIEANGQVQGGDGGRPIENQTFTANGSWTTEFIAISLNGISVLRLQFEGMSTTSAPTLGLGAMSATTWAVPLGAGLFLAAGGVAATRFLPSGRPSKQVIVPSGPGPKRTPTQSLEARFRENPSSVQSAMELALQYASEDRHRDALPLLLMAMRHYPKSDVVRYTTALALLHAERVEEAVRHLEYSFRLNPINVARFIREGPARVHGKRPEVAKLIQRWARVYHETNSRGYV